MPGTWYTCSVVITPIMARDLVLPDFHNQLLGMLGYVFGLVKMILIGLVPTPHYRNLAYSITLYTNI